MVACPRGEGPCVFDLQISREFRQRNFFQKYHLILFCILNRMVSLSIESVSKKKFENGGESNSLAAIQADLDLNIKVNFQT